jgi:hypothetical protein
MVGGRIRAGLMPVSWNDSSILYKRDPPRRARYRLLQSWYREHVLDVPPGTDDKGHCYGNLLPTDAVAADPTLNFLQDAGLEATARARVKEAVGTFEERRLYTNLLSSQPLCVNLFGALKREPAAAARVLTAAFGIDVAAVDDIRIEWAPAPASDFLNDPTAFDTIIDYRDSDECRGFVAVETKYTDSFSSDNFDDAKRTKYRDKAFEAEEFDPQLGDELFTRATSQQFRNTLLAFQWRRMSGVARGDVVVIGCADDPDPATAAELINPWIVSGDQVRVVNYETIIETAASEPTLATWANAFRRRYLDCTPIEQQAIG